MCLVTQLCPTLCNPMDCSPPRCSVHGIVQARILEWIFPDPGIELRSPALQAGSLDLSSNSPSPGRFLWKPGHRGLGVIYKRCWNREPVYALGPAVLQLLLQSREGSGG